MEVDEEDEGYAIGEQWDGGLRESEASRSFGGCLGQGETAVIFQEQREEAGDWGDHLRVLISTEELVLYL